MTDGFCIMNKFVVLPWGRFKAMEKASSIIQSEEVPIPDGDNYTQKQQSSTKPQLVKQAGSGGETLGDNQPFSYTYYVNFKAQLRL